MVCCVIQTIENYGLQVFTGVLVALSHRFFCTE